MQPGAVRGQPLGGLRGQKEEVFGGGGGEEGRSWAWVLLGLGEEKAGLGTDWGGLERIGADWAKLGRPECVAG
jgi:hypothetical protein